MRILRPFLFSVITFSLFLGCAPHRTEVIHPEFSWEFRHPDSSRWLPASVPGCTHLDLIENGLIPDPFFADNELKLQWIGESEWEYRASFNGGSLVGSNHVELVFEGLDVYADIYLNDSLLFHADNMFRTWIAGVDGLLRDGNNMLTLRFYPPGEVERKKADQLDHALPEIRGFTRKAPYQYGWDWGPRFITSGIWKPFYFRTWEKARITDVKLLMEELNENEARYLATLSVESGETMESFVRVFVDGKENGSASRNMELKSGLNQIVLPITIREPQLWWPAGMGEQPLYTFEFELRTTTDLDVRKIRTGIRTAELIVEQDSIGESFYFRINGVPVFMKGANYIPQDNFLPRVREQDYRRVLQTALDAHMNMLRVWGGGIYESDFFYDFCDEHGILLWQDFMFACNMYPGDRAFVDNVRHEVVDQVRRLRDHPSVVLWCGNNEVEEGWHNWGWQEALGYSPEDSAEVWGDYVRIFHELIPSILEEESPTHPYVPSSPRIGWGHEEALLEGDMHYWGVWWGEEPFEIYEKKVGRFMSEFGFQGFPDLRTLRSMVDPEDLLLESQVLGAHQKHPRGMELIRTYMERDFPVPVSFDDYVYVSQLLQAYGMRTALEAHRRAKPRCMGTLYWQLNDCWPVISWSSIDHAGRWKAMHYAVRDIYADFLVSFDDLEDGTAVFVVSDLQKDTAATLLLQQMDFAGNVQWQESREILIPANSSKVYQLVPSCDVNPVNTLLSAGLYSSGELIARNFHYFVPPELLELIENEVVLETVAEEDAILLRLSSDHLAKNVWLNCRVDGFFSDNYFDLLPGSPVEVRFSPRQRRPLTADDFSIRHLGEVTARQNRD